MPGIRRPLPIPGRVILNVGGVKYETNLSTLTAYPDTMLGRMFLNGSHLRPENLNEYFIDRSGKYFDYVMQFYRNGKAFWLENASVDHINSKELAMEYDYYLIPYHVQICDQAKAEDLSVLISRFENLFRQICKKHLYKIPKSSSSVNVLKFKLLFSQSGALQDVEGDVTLADISNLYWPDFLGFGELLSEFVEEIGEHLAKKIQGFTWKKIYQTEISLKDSLEIALEVQLSIAINRDEVLRLAGL
ncbi:hypothetical protein G9A89_016836 [Geosiphon pyriformis]|nr:hypothetical protein G9A89_016836 [Geosiphon pyriformis]